MEIPKNLAEFLLEMHKNKWWIEKICVYDKNLNLISTEVIIHKDQVV